MSAEKLKAFCLISRSITKAFIFLRPHGGKGFLSCHTCKEIKMTTKILATIALGCICYASSAQLKNDSTALISRPADVGLIYPISTNGAAAARYSNLLSLQAIAGVSGSIRAAAFAGVANIVKGDARSGMFAGIANIIGGEAKGGQFAGIVNIDKKDFTGFQAAGLLNHTGNVQGVQMAGLSNLTHGESKGVQIAGLYNKANNAGTQIAGLINKAEKVKGLQISGLINIADSSDYPIGFINLIKHGEKNIGISTDQTLNTLLSLRSGGRVLYGIIGMGYHLEGSYDLYALQAGIGAHLLPISPSFRINVEATQLVLTDFSNGHAFTYTLGILPEVRITSQLALFAGPTANLVLDYSHQKFSSLAPHYFWTSRGHSSHFIGAFAGVTGGVTFTL